MFPPSGGLAAADVSVKCHETAEHERGDANANGFTLVGGLEKCDLMTPITTTGSLKLPAAAKLERGDANANGFTLAGGLSEVDDAVYGRHFQ